MTDEVLRSLFRQAGLHRPTTLTLLSDPSHELLLKETAFSALHPLLLLRPLLRLAAPLPAPVQQLCLLLLSALLSCFALILARRARSTIYPSSSSMLSEGLLLCLPAAFSLCLPYSEPLYLLLSSGLLLCLARGHVRRACAVSLLLPLCRPLGIFTALPLLCYSWQAVRDRRLGQDAPRLPLLPLLLLPLSPVVGQVLHVWFKAALLGVGPWASFTSQSSFIATFSLSKLLLPTHLLRELLVGRQGGCWRRAEHDPLDSPIDRLFFLAALLLLALTARRLPLHVWAFSLVHLTVPPLAGSFMSYTRFFLVGACPLLWALELRGAEPGQHQVVVQQGKAHESDEAAGEEGEAKEQRYRPIAVPVGLAWGLAGTCMAVQLEFLRRFMATRWAF